MPEAPVARAVSAALRGRIAKARPEQRDLATQLGMSKYQVGRPVTGKTYQVGRLVTGKTVMGIDDADMLCAALGIDLLAVLREAMDAPNRPRRLLSVDERLNEGF